MAWVTGPWFLSIFMNMLPWESGQVLCCILLILKLICVDPHNWNWPNWVVAC